MASIAPQQPMNQIEIPACVQASCLTLVGDIVRPIGPVIGADEPYGISPNDKFQVEEPPDYRARSEIDHDQMLPKYLLGKTLAGLRTLGFIRTKCHCGTISPAMHPKLMFWGLRWKRKNGDLVALGLERQRVQDKNHSEDCFIDYSGGWPCFFQATPCAFYKAREGEFQPDVIGAPAVIIGEK